MKASSNIIKILIVILLLSIVSAQTGTQVIQLDKTTYALGETITGIVISDSPTDITIKDANNAELYTNYCKDICELEINLPVQIEGKYTIETNSDIETFRILRNKNLKSPIENKDKIKPPIKTIWSAADETTLIEITDKNRYIYLIPKEDYNEEIKNKLDIISIREITTNGKKITQLTPEINNIKNKTSEIIKNISTLPSYSTKEENLTIKANGTVLYECLEYNNLTKECNTTWEKIKELKINQTYKLVTKKYAGYKESLEIINLQSYPIIKGEWKVEFTTKGKQDLIISLQNTTWTEIPIDILETRNDLKFISLKCGNNTIEPELKLTDGKISSYSQLENESYKIESLLVKDWECNKTASITNKEYTKGKHHITFRFGSIQSTANNYAGIPPFATMLSGASGDANSATDITTTWSTENRIDLSTYSHQTSEITVKEAGIYRIDYGLYITTTGTNRYQALAHLQINGTDAKTCYDSGYNRGSSGSQNLITAGRCIVNLTSNENLSIAVRRVSSDNGQTPSINGTKSWFHITKIEYPEVLILKDSTGNAAFDAADINPTFDTIKQKDNAFDFTSGSSEIKVTKKGFYRLTYGIGTTQDSNNRASASVEVSIKPEGGSYATSPYGWGHANLRGNTASRDSAISSATILNLSINDTIQLILKRASTVDPGTMTTVGGRIHLDMEYLGPKIDGLFVYDNAGGDDLDPGPLDQTWDTKDYQGDSFNHTTTHSDIEIKEDGLYMISYSIYSLRSAGSGRFEHVSSLRINDIEQNVCFGAGYNRGDQGTYDSFTSAVESSCIIELSAGEKIEIRNTKTTTETDQTIPTAGDRTSLTIINLDSIISTITPINTTYIIDSEAKFKGEFWPPQSNITINITDAENNLLTNYPKTKIANISGEITDSYYITKNNLNGTYTIKAYLTDTPTVITQNTFKLIKPTVSTNKENFVRGEIIKITGKGYKSGENLTLTIFDPFLDPVSGFPKTIVINNSGEFNSSLNISQTSPLGTYKINATETENRTSETTYEVVTAIITADKSIYKQGESINISGSSWDSSINVTINITAPNGSLVYGPINKTTNSTGHLIDNWTSSYNQPLGSYLISAYEPTAPNKKDTYSFTIEKRIVNITTDYEWYKSGEQINITISGISPFSNTQIDIKNETEISVSGYPKIIAANKTGELTDSWISIQNTGNYNISAVDQTYSNLAKNKTITIEKQTIATDNTAYSSGDLVTITGTYWDRFKNITLDIINSTGQSMSGYPKIITTASDGTWSDEWIAQPGAGFSIETYNLTANVNGASEKNDTTSIDVTKTATINAGTYHFPNTLVPITGSFYSSSGEVELSLYSLSTNGIALEYPKKVTATSIGNITDNWNTSNYCAGTYLIESKDLTYPNLLKANTTFQIQYNDPTEQDCTSLWGFDCGAGPAESGDNTFDACSTGTGNDESVEQITINTTIANPGENISVTCTFDPYTSNDYLNIWYYNGTAWKRLYHEGPMGDSSNIDRTITFLAEENPGTHWIRCMIDYQQDTADECADTGSYYDNDDINFTVIRAPSSCIEFDGEKPEVTQINPQNTTGKLGLPIIITSQAEDENNISKVWAIITKPDHTNTTVQMPWTGTEYKGTFSNTIQLGLHKIRIYANDTWKNINSTETGNFTIIYDTLKVKTNQQSYIYGEDAIISATGFDYEENVSINIINETNNSVEGYPKTFIANETGGVSNIWTIPLTQTLGTYKINATGDVRSATTEIKIVTAVVETEKAKYETGEEVYISGYSWDPLSDVEITVTDSTQSIIYGPTNITSNGTGHINTDFNLTYNEELGETEIFAIQPSKPAKNNSFTFEIIKRKTPLTTEYKWYRINDKVTIEGRRFSPSSTININISKETPLSGYPTTENTDSIGNFTHIWTIAETQELGTYKIETYDTSYSNLYNETEIEIVKENLTTQKQAYKSGEEVIISGKYWNRTENITITIINQTGQIISGYPKNITTNSDGTFETNWIAQPGTGFTISKYNITTTQGDLTSKTTIEVTRSAHLSADRTSYLPNTILNLTGDFFSITNNVTLTIYSITSQANAEFYPKEILTNTGGSFEHLWNTTNYCEGDMIATAIDNTYPELLYDNITFKLQNRDPTPKDCTSLWGFDCGAGPAESGDNTFDACPTGTGNDESVEEITINSTIANPGETIEVTCTFDPYTSNDYLNIWYYNGTAWKRLYHEGPMGDSSNIERSVTTTIDNVTGTHWFRCMIDYQQNTADECADSGSYYDNDDINLTVIPKLNPCKEFDATSPTINKIGPNSSYNHDSIIEIFANATDNQNLSSVTATIILPNTTTRELTLTKTTITDYYNTTFTETHLLGSYNLTITAKDTSANENYSSILFEITDTKAPNWNSPITNPISPTIYNNPKEYEFNITWIDDYALDKIWIEHNFTKILINETINSFSEVFSKIKENLSAGIYSWKYYANDTSGNKNSSQRYTYIVQRKQSQIELLFNSTEENITILPNTIINITAKTIEPTFEPIQILNNQVEIASGTSPISTDESFASLDYINITAIYSGNENYTPKIKTLWINVSDNVSPEILFNPPTEELRTGDNINLTSNITDNFAIDKVWIWFWNSVLDLFKEFTWFSGDEYRLNITLNDSFIGKTNYTIYANDTSGNIKNQSGNLITLGTLKITTDKSSYIKEETVYINASGYNLSTTLTIAIKNETGNLITGYPKEIASDEFGKTFDSWIIPIDQKLGLYNITINDSTHKTSKLFDIVNAVIYSTKETYTQGDEIEIEGYSWDSDTLVKINITNPSGTIIFGPEDLTTNSSGWLNKSITLNYSTKIGTYKISAYQISNENKTDTSTFEVISKEVTLTSDYTWYKSGEIINLIGTSYPLNANITIEIEGETPIETTANSTGGFKYPWEITKNIGNYKVTAKDKDYPNLNSTINLEVLEEIINLNDHDFNNGETVTITGKFWNRTTNLTIDVFNLTGQSISEYPKIILTNENGEFINSWTAKTQGIENTDYNITVTQGSVIKNSNITVHVAATLDTDKKYYDQNKEVKIKGEYYTKNQNVEINITNTITGAQVPKSPFLTTAGTESNITYLWNTTDYCEARYKITATDKTHPELLFAKKYIDIENYQINITNQTPTNYILKGNFNNNNSGISNLNSLDSQTLWFGSKDYEGRTNGWLYINISTPYEKINEINLTIDYCHSGMQSSPACEMGSAIEGTANKPQMIEIYNNGWNNLTELKVNETDSLQELKIQLSENLTQNLRIRIAFDFNTTGYNDALLLIDRIKTEVNYRDHVERNCTLVDDILGNESNINQTGITPTIKIDKSPMNLTKDYRGIKEIKIYNNTTPLIKFLHNFTKPLNLSTITIIQNNLSVSAKIINQTNFTLIIPLIDEQCNVLICPNTLKKGGCGPDNYTLYSEPINGYCEVNVTGTWAQDAPDKTDFELLETDFEVPENLTENKETELNITVYNRGNTKVAGLLLEIYDLTHNSQINLTNISLMNPKSSTTITGIKWNVTLGGSKIEARVDPYNDYGEYNETNNNVSKIATSSSWTTFYGHILSNITLRDSSNTIAYEWTTAEPKGHLFIANADADINWKTLFAVGRTKTNTLATDDFLQTDIALGTENFTDNITTTYSASGIPKDTLQLNLSTYTIQNAPIINSTNSSTFFTALLWDGSDTAGTEYTGTEDIIFATKIEDNKPGYFGTVDYEIKIPAKLRKETTKEVKIYVEIK